MSMKQSMVTLSTIETEYNATTHTSKEGVWMQQLCIDIGFEKEDVRLGCDNHRQSS